MIEEASNKVNNFSKQYFLLRKKEGRIYSDKEVAALPEIEKGHKHYHEWLVRKDSCERLVKYLVNRKRNLEIMEIGCGNGWLSAKLSAVPTSHVTGIDIGTEELNQAKRVFDHIEMLEFFNCSVHDEIVNNRQFDVIVFAASIQYFSSLEKIIADAVKLLKPGGEIHIIDSHFYNEKEVEDARLRSHNYYNVIGFPGLSNNYFHHSLEELKSFNHVILYNPGSIINRLRRNRNPFYWICIRNNA
jgi:SAM-dependent methyltransferase